ncbi:MAG: YcxB family protein [Gammaproteobacteria bacterium]|nr:YcxB family protein [Gammaproteobacteria bacterium]
MRVTTDISRIDLLKFNLRFMVTSSYMYKYFSIVVTIVLAIVFWKAGLPDTQEKWMISIVGAFLSGLAATAIYFLFCIGSILLRSNTLNGILGVHEYELRDEGLFEKTTANETLNRWEGLGKVAIAGPYLLLQVSGFLYHIFPKRCFKTEEDFNSFKTALQNKVYEAQNKPL